MNNYTIHLNQTDQDGEANYYSDIYADYYTFEGCWICFYKNEKVDSEIPEIITPAVCVFRIRESVVEAIAIENYGRG